MGIQLDQLTNPLNEGVVMNVIIDKVSGIPIYIQVKNQIKHLIDDNLMIEGEKLPTERELAKELDVSRNTVSMAYESLQDEGYISIGQGKGTFVIGRKEADGKTLHSDSGSSKKEKAMRLIDFAIDECLDLGFSLEQFIALSSIRVREREMSLQKSQVLFIDCNEEQLLNFARQFRETVQLQIIPMLLHKFMSFTGTVTEMANLRNLLNQIDLVVTTSTHFDDVSRVLEKITAKVEVVLVSAQPKMESLIRLVRLSARESVGLVCISDQFPQIVKRSLAKLGVSDIQVDYTTSSDCEELRSFIEQHDVLLAFRDRFKEVKALAGEKEVISYLHELDTGSVSLVRRIVDRIMKEKAKDEHK